MTFLSEFSYPDISQRRILLFNSLLTYLVSGLIFTNALIVFKYYFIYQSVSQILFIIVLIGYSAGNLLGKFIFPRIKKHRIIYIAADILFILLCAFYIYIKVLIRDDIQPLPSLFFRNPYYSILPLALISIFIGIKSNYFLKISCGDFIDGKRAVISYLLSIILGLVLGILLAIALHYLKNYFDYSGILLILIIPTIFLIRLSYSPKPIYARELTEPKNGSNDSERQHKRDDLFFIYLNFTYIIVYLFLAFTSIMKYSGDFLQVNINFIIIALSIFAFGLIISRMLKKSFWYIYAEMLFPIFFLISQILILLLKGKIPTENTLYLFIPVFLLAGFSLSSNINHILDFYNHKNRFSVIDFSIFILPIPILIALNFINFTYMWFFILLYTVSFVNIFIPGIYLLQTKIRGYKKMVYFFFVLIFIPLVILTHMYFNIPLNNNLYVTHTTGFENLNHLNYNSQYIGNEATVYIHGIKSFHADDAAIKNIKRSLIPAMFYTNNNSGEVLIIDGNRKFFKNPVITVFNNTTCLDYVPSRLVDNNTIAVSGDQTYFLAQSDILSFLQTRQSTFKMIVDIPNLYDQALNAFRFSKEYYNIINRYLVREGIFIQIIDMANCRNDFFVYAGDNLKSSYKKIIGYYFPEYLVLVASDADEALRIDANNIQYITDALESKVELQGLFYNETHLFSHILFLDIDELTNTIVKRDIDPFYFLNTSNNNFKIDKNLRSAYTDDNSKFLTLIKDSDLQSGRYLLKKLKFQLSLNNSYLSDLKKAELYEVDKDYEKESLQLIKLKMQSEYMPDLRKYIMNILSYKEKYYFNIALNFEKDKEWEIARSFYKAILTINKNNFEANYRLGILSIILQDLNAAFEYLQYAMHLKKDDPKVLYQIGVLLFSNGRPREALVYLEKALEFKERSSSLYYYLGLSNEELGNLFIAKEYYDQAIILDPNDKNIASSIERIKEKLNNKNWKNEREVNKENTDSKSEGEVIELPKSEGATDMPVEEENPVQQ